MNDDINSAGAGQDMPEQEAPKQAAPERPAPQYVQQQYTQPQAAGYRWDYGEVSSHTRPVMTNKKKNRGLIIFVAIFCSIALIAGGVMTAAGVYRLVTGELLFGSPSSSGAQAPESSRSEQSGQPSGASSGDGTMPDIVIEDKPKQDNDAKVGDQLTPREIYKLCSPYVVGVLSYYDMTYTSMAQGSGIIMSSDGYIITNAHVVVSAISYQVVMPDGEYHDAQLVGYDNQTDIAVLKIDGDRFPHAVFGDSDQLEVGELVVAIGNPDGLNLATTQTVGYISALDRLIETESTYTMECIQSDAAINPGSSGGPLINEYGMVVGINSAKLADVDFEGIGFSIPINTALPIVEDLITNGKVTGRAMIGFTTNQAIDAGVASYYGIPTGLVIAGFSDGSDLPAKGVRVGDIVTHINGQAIASLGDCSTELKKYRPGDSVTLSIYRINNSATYSGQSFEVEITLIGS